METLGIRMHPPKSKSVLADRLFLRVVTKSRSYCPDMPAQREPPLLTFSFKCGNNPLLLHSPLGDNVLL